jgi:hypothetical protein
MKISENTYLTVQGTKFTIKDKHNRWYIAFNINNKRKNKSTGLESSKKNLIVVKKEIIPQIAEELLSIKHNGYINPKITDDDTILENFAEEHFLLHKENVRPHVYKRDYSNYERCVLKYFTQRSLELINDFLVL